MKIENNIKIFLEKAASKALGTCCNGKVNVIPVSTIKVLEEEIWLINYFMGKTVVNINNNNLVSLTCWTGLDGYQIIAECDYIEDNKNEKLQIATDWVKQILPKRVVRGLLILKPTQVLDVSVQMNAR